jgi:hypothetical protein
MVAVAANGVSFQIVILRAGRLGPPVFHGWVKAERWNAQKRAVQGLPPNQPILYKAHSLCDGALYTHICGIQQVRVLCRDHWSVLASCIPRIARAHLIQNGFIG